MFDKLAEVGAVERAKKAFEANGFAVRVAATGAEAKETIAELIPAGAEVMTMTSVTLDTLGVAKDLNESGRYGSVRAKYLAPDSKAEAGEKRRRAAAPDYVIGSVHAVTEDGKVLIASNTGSQLPAYVYGAAHVVWVVGTQKLVKNVDEGMKRIYEYVLPLESERAHKAYGVPGSFVSKLLIVNKEVQPGRVTIIFVQEKLGF